MKTKLIIYVLAGMVLCVWGIILYRILKTIDNDGTRSNLSANTLPADKVDIPKLYPDTFSTRLDFPDPFTGAVAVLADSAMNEKKAIRVDSRIAPLSDAVQQPKYLGYVKDRRGKNGVAILSHNGQERMLKQGDTLGGFKLKSIHTDKIIVSYHNRSITIKAE
jgi:hypothetical protein